MIYIFPITSNCDNGDDNDNNNNDNDNDNDCL